MSNTRERSYDKNQAVITLLQTCPSVINNKLYFNFGELEDNAFHAITESDDISLQRPFIDGSISKRYTLNLDCFKSVSPNSVITPSTDENMTEMAYVQAIIDWIQQQDDLHNFPDFGTDFIVERISTLQNTPYIMTVDTNAEPAVAVYRVSIQVDYIDNSHILWKS